MITFLIYISCEIIIYLDSGGQWRMGGGGIKRALGICRAGLEHRN